MVYRSFFVRVRSFYIAIWEVALGCARLILTYHFTKTHFDVRHEDGESNNKNILDFLDMGVFQDSGGAPPSAVREVINPFISSTMD